MNLQESIRIILREEFDKVMNMQSKILSQFRKQDQMERNEYSKFVQSEFGGDYERGAKEYAKIKNRNSDDIFGDKKRIREFILINFDFNTFSSKDWENYWLLSQHSDNHPEFQKKALNIIKQNLGEDNEYYEYLHDRISCRESGTQIYGTQNICKKSKMNLQESIRRILREENKKSGLLKAIEEDGLYQVIQDTGLSMGQIILKYDNLPREVFERYIKDFINEEGYHQTDGSVQLVYVVKIQTHVYIDHFYMKGDKVTLEISRIDNLGNQTEGYIESLSNLTDEEIFTIVDDMTGNIEDN